MVQKINEIVSQLVKVCPTPYRAKVHHLCLETLADNHTLQFMNQGLFQKQQQARQNKTKKHFGTARVLIVEKAIKKQKERKAKEQQVIREKERAAALYCKVGFAKAVLKELHMDFDQPSLSLQSLPLNRFGNGWPDRAVWPEWGPRRYITPGLYLRNHLEDVRNIVATHDTI